MYRLRDLEFNLEIQTKRTNKKSYIRVKGSDYVLITTPLLKNDKRIYAFLDSSYDFLKKALRKAKSNEEAKEEANIVHFLGKPYNLVIKSGNNTVFVAGNDMIVYAKHSDIGYVKAVIYTTLYKDELERQIHLHFKDAISSLGVGEKRVSFIFKDVKGYYGKCYYKENKIILALSLAKYDPIYIKSVIFHEVAHFIYQDHQKGFYELLEYAMPGYKGIQHELRMTKYNDIC